MIVFRIKYFILFIIIGAALISLSWNTRPPSNYSLPNFQAPQRTHQFIQYQINDLDIYNPEEKFNGFFEKLKKLVFEGEGKISIVHMGGSHVQGGALTDRMRTNFSTLAYGLQGDRGLVFPFKLAGTNSPWSIQCKWTGNWSGCRNSVSSHSCNWGVSGIAAVTTDSIASIEVFTQASDSSLNAFDRIKIYYQASEGYGLYVDSTMNVIEHSHSDNGGYDEFIFDRFYSSAKIHVRRPGNLPGEFDFQGFYFGSEEPGIAYNPIGVNGAGTYSYLRCGLFEEQMKTLKPDLVLFGIGVNDANVPSSDFDDKLYEARYDSIISKIESANPDVCFIFITNNDTYYNRKYPNKNAIKVQEAMQRLAEKHNGAVYDLFAIMGGLGSIDDWRDANLAAKDRIHLTRSGYELQADLMFDAFRRSFGDYLDEFKNQY